MELKKDILKNIKYKADFLDSLEKKIKDREKKYLENNNNYFIELV